MKKYNKYKIFLTILLVVFILQAFQGCKKFLKEDVYTQYSPAEFLNTEDGIQKVLIGAYSRLQVIDGAMKFACVWSVLLSLFL